MADNIIPPRRNEFVTKEGVPTTRFAEYLEEVANNINATIEEDEIFVSLSIEASAVNGIKKQLDDIQLELKTGGLNAAVAQLSAKVDALDALINLSVSPKFARFKKKHTVVATDVDYTTVGDEIVICNNVAPAAVTITVRNNPNQLEHVIIARKDGPVNYISAEGINGSTSSASLATAMGAIELVYTHEAGEYTIISEY